MSHLITLGAADCCVMLIGSAGKLWKEINSYGHVVVAVIPIFIPEIPDAHSRFGRATHLSRSVISPIERGSIFSKNYGEIASRVRARALIELS